MKRSLFTLTHVTLPLNSSLRIMFGHWILFYILLTRNATKTWQILLRLAAHYILRLYIYGDYIFACGSHEWRLKSTLRTDLSVFINHFCAHYENALVNYSNTSSLGKRFIRKPNNTTIQIYGVQMCLKCL